MQHYRLFQKFESVPTQEFADAFANAIAMIREVDHRVDLILDLDLGMKHTNQNVLGQMKETFSDLPPNLGIVASKGASRFGKIIAEVFTRVVGWQKRVFFVQTLDEAREVIRAQRGQGVPTDPGHAE